MKQSPKPKEHLILVIDDDHRICEVLKGMIEESPEYRTLCAHDGENGLAMITEEKPDAIVLDIMMPGMTGLELLEKVKANPKTAFIPVIMLTGQDHRENLTEAMYLYAEEFISKPCSREKLMASLERVLAWRDKNTKGKASR